ncbi:hypothetical protein [Roseibium sp. RKSG952]|uniref:hypothetical protein n=1 Tax=Roseibium sp. RKSG952 TaxID=2529384 RepID=UPI0012BC0ED2|nr:hypothetical protein [Roseibium sp. RKSG952]MTH97596.1 hypothetical protein [Roseibium sp. RKSG952]
MSESLTAQPTASVDMVPPTFSTQHFAQESVFGWSLSQLSPFGTSQVPKLDKLFMHNTSTALNVFLREMTQNSLDAASSNSLGKNSVRIRIKLAKVNRAEFKRAFLNGLEPHLEACERLGFPKEPVSDEATCLIYEDYGTSGLRGPLNPAQSQTSEYKNFSKYFFEHGESHKDDSTSGGRHGVGKITGPLLSSRNMIMAVTRRDCSPNLVAYGQAILFPHYMPDGTRYEPVANYGVRTGEGSEPIVGRQASRLVDRLGFDRSDKNGLSLFIYDVKAEEIDRDVILRELIKHCFVQICEGQLSFDVFDRHLDKNNILSVASEFDETLEYVPLIRLVQTSREDTFNLKTDRLTSSTARGVVSGESFTESELEELSVAFEEGRPIRVKFPVYVCRRDGDGIEKGYGELLIRKHEDKNTCREVYARGRVTVISQKTKGGNYVAVFNTHDKVLSTFLGDAENVSHTAWRESLVRDSYRNPLRTLRVKSVAADVYLLATGAGDGKTIKNALKDFFYTPDAPTNSTVRPSREEKAGETARPQLELVPQPKKFAVSETHDGFVVRCAPADGSRHDLNVTAFYGGFAGKPKYEKWDFEFGEDVSIEVNGPHESVAILSGNEVAVRGVSAGCEIRATGFDGIRDVHVYVKHKQVEEV